MLAKPTIPAVPTVIDLRFREPGRRPGDLFEGWGVQIGGPRF